MKAGKLKARKTVPCAAPEISRPGRCKSTRGIKKDCRRAAASSAKTRGAGAQGANATEGLGKWLGVIMPRRLRRWSILLGGHFAPLEEWPMLAGPIVICARRRLISARMAAPSRVRETRAMAVSSASRFSLICCTRARSFTSSAARAVLAAPCGLLRPCMVLFVYNSAVQDFVPAVCTTILCLQCVLRTTLATTASTELEPPLPLPVPVMATTASALAGA